MTNILPKVQYPTISIKIPPTNKGVLFRTMVVREEKLLLMAKVSEDPSDILQSIKQVVNNCCLDPKFDVNKTPLFVLEYIFIKLRAFSIGDIIDVSYLDYDDDKQYDFKIDLKDVEIKFPENIDPKIEITKTSGIVMDYPTADVYDDKGFLRSVEDEMYYKLIVKSIKQIYDTENVYDAKDFEEKDLMEFIELVDIKSFEKIRNFMENIPTIEYTIKYTNSVGNKKEINLRTLSDFFTFR